MATARSRPGICRTFPCPRRPAVRSFFVRARTASYPRADSNPRPPGSIRTYPPGGTHYQSQNSTSCSICRRGFASVSSGTRASRRGPRARTGTFWQTPPRTASCVNPIRPFSDVISHFLRYISLLLLHNNTAESHNTTCVCTL